ncbi:MAG TPA: glycosyltransferase [Bacteroidia bacterium]|jgi:glycosyltransferase involved in cell wall biosynthesis|nr:glycosyltransferase [Bacteroidia bacterium]
MNDKRKALVILTPGFPKDEQDTTCLPFLQDYLNAFARLHPEIKIFVIAFQYPFKKGNYKWNGVNVYSGGGGTKYLNRLFVWNRIYRHLKQLHYENTIIAVHSFWLTGCTLVAQRFCKKSGIKHVAYAIGQDVLKTNRYLSLLDYSKMKVAAMSESIAKKFGEQTGRSAQYIIASGVNMDKIDNDNNRRDIDIIGVGALIPLKNYTLFIDLVNSLKADFQNIKACIIGKGELEKPLKEKILSDGLQNNLQLEGEVTHKEVFHYLSKSKIFLHTSTYEGQSTVISEALACGLNVVCFDIGRIDVKDKVNVCKTEREMIETLKKLLSSELTYKPALLRTPEDMVNDFMKVYEE